MPKVFISYSWTSPKFREQVRQWADRLAADGVDILLDQYDLKEGNDKYAYMEKMVTDPSVTHVLMFIDKRYAEKADARSAGVGTESQIISREVYEKVSQSKFVPIVCELDNGNSPYLPIFASSRIYIDFSSDEMVNRNWEGLVRLLYGKPIHEKPATGRPPAYIMLETHSPAIPAIGKFAVFRNAYIGDRKEVRMYRQDFLDSCVSFIDGLRPRNQPEDHSGDAIIATFKKLTQIRNLLVDWILMEARSGPGQFSEVLIEFMERLLDLRGRPEGVSSWNESWYNSHHLFAYETFLYFVAALLKAEAHEILNSVLMGYYARAQTDSRSGEHVDFDEFYAYSDVINDALLADIGETQNLRYHSQAAELIKRCADRTDIPFNALKEADALCCVASLLRGKSWYPQTHYYWGYGKTALLFFRAIQRKQFLKLKIILGCISGDELRAKLKEKPFNIDSWRSNVTLERFICLDKVDTLG